jgi:hypothetical protein
MTTPLWKGPIIDGVSQSFISKFLQCPYRCYLYAILGLRDDTPLHPNLIWGDCFHKGLEIFLQDFNINNAIEQTLQHRATKHPTAPSTYDISLSLGLRNYGRALTEPVRESTWQTEVVFDTVYEGFRIRGKLDGITRNHSEYGSALIEHKTKGYIDAEQTRKELQQDLQLNYYMFLHDVEWVYYDLILIPEAQKYTPARNYNESPQDWMSRLHTGPCGKYSIYPINSNRPSWQRQVTTSLPREMQEEYWDVTVLPILKRISMWYDWVTQSNFDPDNPKFYNDLFYKVPPRLFNGSFTEKFQCEYYSYLIGEQSLQDLVPVTSIFNELEEL